MSETPSEFFGKRGFELSYSTHTDSELAGIYDEAIAGLSQRTQRDVRNALANGRIGPVFTDLHAPNGQVLRGYGTGQDELAAGSRAVERWKQEQGD